MLFFSILFHLFLYHALYPILFLLWQSYIFSPGILLIIKSLGSSTIFTFVTREFLLALTIFSIGSYKLKKIPSYPFLFPFTFLSPHTTHHHCTNTACHHFCQDPKPLNIIKVASTTSVLHDPLIVPPLHHMTPLPVRFEHYTTTSIMPRSQL